jgi:hypothetical protein
VRDDGDLLERLLGFDGRDLKEKKRACGRGREDWRDLDGISTGHSSTSLQSMPWTRGEERPHG